MAEELFEHQRAAIEKLKTGAILCGGVGSGKSRTALAYYFCKECGGFIDGFYEPMINPKDLYIITTARKRDTLEWNKELIPFLLSSKEQQEKYGIKIIIDSWNNIKKYIDVDNSFFIFDEQRVVGSGVWVKSFLKITKNNNWILLSATPGDTWSDYIPVFIANGFYKNRTEFIARHVVESKHVKYFKIDHYVETGRLIKLRNSILVNMSYLKKTVPNIQTVITDYDNILYKSCISKRWNIYTEEPVKNASELCYLMRRIVNSDYSKLLELKRVLDKHEKVIVFYNFDYELELIRNMAIENGIARAEWNGHKHEPIPKNDRWLYLVQYAAGAEGWNCIETNTIVFFSQNYSYKTMIQASGRIDRLNTPFEDLYYYHFRTTASIDIAIYQALKKKKKFNESSFFQKLPSQ